jgi:hypothetical protein
MCSCPTSNQDRAYTYDANGNMTKNSNKSITWTSFNKPKKFTKGGDSTTFTKTQTLKMTIVSGLRIIDSNAQTVITWWNWTYIYFYNYKRIHSAIGLLFAWCMRLVRLLPMSQV